MAISERDLAENEVKLDNMLHKIVESAKQIRELKDNINPAEPAEYDKQCLEQIDLLAQIIQELAEAADLIDITDERITEQLENGISAKLDEAIQHITAARQLMK
jgi:uncharacterized phage infection (PIP) family protein YhgE